MKKAFLVFVASFLLLAVHMPAHAAGNAKRENILKLLEMTGAKNIAVQFGQGMNQQIVQILKASNPNMPERAFVIVGEEVDRLLKQEAGALMEVIIPLYDKYFTEAELKEMIKFYQTPVGKKTIQVMPQLLQESMAVGQTWGEGVAPKLFEQIEKRFKQENIPLPQ